MRATIERLTLPLTSARTLQAAAMFDVPPEHHDQKRWEVDLPIEEKDWNVGLIVGPSGSGKSTVARELFGAEPSFEWTDRALLDDFPQGMAAKDVVGLLTAVGFGSAPSWFRPFSTLSNGEQFRVTCARALAETPQGEITFLDEFTSVVDRQVAQVASSTVAKAVRRQGRKLVAASCHYDIEDWLQPDWVYQPHLGKFTWRSVQPRPRVTVEIAEIDRSAWPLFRPYHYLSGELLTSAKCYGAFVPSGECVAFTSYRHLPHSKVKDIKMGHRLVVLPDWQGLGLGLALDDWLGELLHKQGFRYRNTVSHPAMVHAYNRSPRWALTLSPGKKSLQTQKTRQVASVKALATSFVDPRRLNTWSFQYVPEPKR